uniref:Secreted protein n=1 Tax=Parascaris univalens TaxID=6257 RepID=A0A915AIA5_PARUN
MQQHKEVSYSTHGSSMERYFLCNQSLYLNYHIRFLCVACSFPLSSTLCKMHHLCSYRHRSYIMTYTVSRIVVKQNRLLFSFLPFLLLLSLPLKISNMEM